MKALSPLSSRFGGRLSRTGWRRARGGGGRGGGDRGRKKFTQKIRNLRVIEKSGVVQRGTDAVTPRDELLHHSELVERNGDHHRCRRQRRGARRRVGAEARRLARQAFDESRVASRRRRLQRGERTGRRERRRDDGRVRVGSGLAVFVVLQLLADLPRGSNLETRDELFIFRHVLT